MEETDERFRMFEINIAESLKEGDLVQIKYNQQIIARFQCKKDKFAVIEKLALVKVDW